MKSYRTFFNSINEGKTSIAFSYNDGGQDQIVLISGSPSEIGRVKNKLSSSTEMLDAEDYDSDDENIWKISAKEWLKIK